MVDQETLNKEREKARQERVNKKKTNTSWSQQTNRKEERDKRREKREKKKNWLKEQRSMETATPDNTCNKRLHPELISRKGDEDDWDDLAKEERMAKKLRKGEISQQDFDTAFADL